MEKYLLLTAAAFLGCASAANAQSVNFDEFTSPPVTCCYLTTGVQGPLVYPSVTIHDANNGGFVMNGSGWYNLQTSGDNLFGTKSGSISFDFSNPVNGLSFDLINGTIASGFTVDVFGAGNVLLDSQVVTLDNFPSSSAVGHITFGDSGIVNALITGDTNFAVDTISFNATGAVPEPATWAMMLLGFGAIGFAMRRRKPAALQLV